MPRRTAKKNKNARGCLGAMLWIVVGIFIGIGAAAAVAVYVNKLHLPFVESPTRDSLLTPEQSRQRSRQEALDFHDTLKQRQTLPIVEDDDDVPVRRFVWHLQIGAFASQTQADRQRAELALSGYAAIIRPGKTSSGDVYRVWLGPFTDKDDAEAMRAKLALEGFSDIPLLQSAAE